MGKNVSAKQKKTVENYTFFFSLLQLFYYYYSFSFFLCGCRVNQIVANANASLMHALPVCV